MHCPNCEEKFDKKKEICQSCGLKYEDLKLKSVLKTDNPMTISFAKSILQDSNIKYITKGETLRGVYPLGGSLGSVDFLVMQKDEQAAREMLSELA
ncbi:DUF2007 domain-containing protein [Proteinivorax hydrogeniformans]|uniref:DUF2007 domain-containing protein n=1 Tax=Proteinivorax hydrogeniformans TaxID=1826727 RepID=A0AAU8HR52_9FIRM